ncbi:MAG: xanthine dehydrogenase family protein molybdopterin-binding subunit [Dehalococcoidaceae bacterium]|nr:xanthine dehydrogenase family protein molybdopterin-binding subunit [Dehalococcoidaceae bacterium]
MGVWHGSWDGNQIWVDTDVKEQYNYVGQRGMKRKDGYDKVSGKAVYTRDVKLPGMLYAKYLTSPYANAKILSIDTTAAQAYPGVRYILTYEDPQILELKLATRTIPTFYLGNRAYYYGQTVGAIVVADTEQIADEAVKLLDVEWEELSFILDEVEAAQPGATLVDENQENNSIPYGYSATRHVQGDVEAALAAAEHTVNFNAKKAMTYGADVECVSCLIKWEGKLECWFHTQCPGRWRQSLAAFFEVPLNNVIVHSVYQGSQWGQWNWTTSQYNTLPAITGILAKRTGRPVKVLFSRQENFLAGEMDCSTQSGTIGFKSDGTITAVKSTTYFANMGLGPFEHFVENSRIPNLNIYGPINRVNKPPMGAIRCEQSINSYQFCIVNDYVASELNMDPTEVALKNDGTEGKDMAYLSQFKLAHGFPDRDSLKECIDLGKADFGWDSKWHEPGARKLPNGRMHGISFTWDHEWQDCCGDSSIGIAINKDGSVSLMAQVSDIGVNHRSACCQIAAEEMGIPYEKIAFLNKAHETVTFELEPPEGSAAFTALGWAVKRAAMQAKASLLEFVCSEFETSSGWGGHPRLTRYPAFFPGKSPEDLDIKDGVIYEVANPENKKTVAEVAARTGFGGLSAGSSGHAPGVFVWQFLAQPAKADSTCNFYHHWMCRQGNFLEVEVDTETGEVFVTNAMPVNDVGKAISPEAVEGQQYGGVYWAFTRGMLEEYIWDPLTGVQLNPNYLDYRVAGIKDVAWDKINCRIVESGLGFGPYGSCGVGEVPGTQLPWNLGQAIYNAIGKRIEDYPITPDKVLKALGKG